MKCRSAESNSITKLFSRILMVAVVLLCCLSYRNPYPKTHYATPAVSSEYPELELDVEKVVQAGDHLYVLLDPGKGIVQVYDAGGSYKHTFFFDCHKNGGFCLAAEGATAYVQDMEGNVYILNRGEFDHFLAKSDLRELPEDLDFYTPASSEGYEIRKNAVWQISENGEQCIIPAPSVSIQTVLRALLTACILPIGVVLVIGKGKYNPQKVQYEAKEYIYTAE